MQTAIFLLSVNYSNLILCVFNLKIIAGNSGVRAPPTRAPENYEFLFCDFLGS